MVLGDICFCITDNAFIEQIWRHAKTIGIQTEMISLRADHGGASDSASATCSTYLLSIQATSQKPGDMD